MRKSLAIVIPAYKKAFLYRTLSSIGRQTNQNFKLYIGDDASPHDLYSIVEEFKSNINIKYFRFENNLGGEDLVAHWERCIDLTEGEEWIWLFSDDDIMSENCVESFYQALDKNPAKSVFHFDISIINEDDDILKVPNKFPVYLDLSEFNILKWQSKIMSYVVEYVFSRKIYLEKSKFQNFKLAWHSDIATWTKFAYPDGIVTCDNGQVYWRRSDLNITPNIKDRNVVMNKLQSDIDFAQWIYNFYKDSGLLFTNQHKFLLSKRFVQHIFRCKKVISKTETFSLIKAQLSVLNISITYPIWYTYYYYRYLKNS